MSKLNLRNIYSLIRFSKPYTYLLFVCSMTKKNPIIREKFFRLGKLPIVDSSLQGTNNILEANHRKLQWLYSRRGISNQKVKAR